MQTRREQVRAYRFVNRRVVSAMLSGEPETADLPMRRLSLGTFGSAMLAAIVFAGVGVFGLMHPGGGRPAPHSLIIERETGALYLYLDDDLLHPVLNYASARLILGAGEVPTRTMSAASLGELPRGRVLGISGAPDSLPDPKRLVGLPWTVCSAPRSDDLPQPTSQLLLGPAPSGGTDPAGNSLLVAAGSTTGQSYLISRTPTGALRRMKVTSKSVLAALGLVATPVPIGRPVLEGITAGPDLSIIKLTDAGQPSGHKVNGQDAPVGQLSKVDNQYYLMLAAGLVPIGEVTRRLLSGTGNQTPVAITGQDAAAARTDTRLEPPGYPGTIPVLYQPGSQTPTICASIRSAGDSGPDVHLALYDRRPAGLAPVTDLEATAIASGVRGVDRVVVGGGRGALVRALPTPGASAPGATRYLVTDEGRKYPLPDSTDVLTSLGYGGISPTPVSSALLALIPTGPELNPDTARGVNLPTSRNPSASPSTSPSPSPRVSTTPTPPAATTTGPTTRPTSPRPPTGATGTRTSSRSPSPTKSR